MLEETSPSAAATENPWLDLRHYLEGDAGRFFGRDREVTALARLVQQETLTVFYGVSGLGKTSLLLAGLFPELRKGRCLPIRWLVGRADRNASLTAPLLDAFFREAQEHSIEAPPPAPGETLWSYFHRRDSQFWDRSVRPVTPALVLDQFEEIFTTHTWSPGRAGSSISRFLDELSQLIENRPPEMTREQTVAYDSRPVPLHVVFSLREDYLAPLQALRRFIPTLRRNEMRLLRLRKEDALQVVLGREREWAGLFSENASASVLDAVGDARRGALEAAGDRDDGVDPAILSVFLHRLFERAREAGGKITPELVAQHRGNVLDSLYTDALAQGSATGCDAEEIARTQQFLEERLIAGQQPPFRVRLPVAVADERKVPYRALAALREARLITADGPLEPGGDVSEQEASRTLIELTHDCLCDVLLRRLQARRAEEGQMANEIRRQALLKEEVERRGQVLISAAIRSWWKTTIPLLVITAIYLFCQFCVSHADRNRENRRLSATSAAPAGAAAPLAEIDWAESFAQRFLLSDRKGSVPSPNPDKPSAHLDGSITPTPLFRLITACAFFSVVGLAGATGAMISAVERIQVKSQEPEAAHSLRTLSHAEMSIRIVPITGILSAFMLTILFSGGLVSGSLFPIFRASEPWSFVSLAPAQFAKLFVWAFLAGFAERLLPDLLDRLTTVDSDNRRVPGPMASPAPPSQASASPVLPETESAPPVAKHIPPN